MCDPLLAAVIIENRRLKDYDAIKSDFDKLMAADRKELVATVTTAVPMTRKQETALAKALNGNKAIGDGKEVAIEKKEDPDIMGGMIVELEDKVIDASMKTKLQMMKKLLSDGL